MSRYRSCIFLLAGLFVVATIAATIGFYLLFVREAKEYRRTLLFVGAPLAFSPDGTLLASGGAPLSGEDYDPYSDRIVLWDAAAWSQARVLAGHEGRVFAMAWCTDGRRLASGGADRTVRLWNAATGAAEHTLTGHLAQVNAVATSPDGHWLASGDAQGGVRLWSAAEGKLIAAWTAGESEAVTALAFTRDGATLWTGGQQGSLRAWSVLEGTPGRPVASTAGLGGYPGAVRGLAISPDGRRLAVAGRGPQLEVRALPEGRVLQAWGGSGWDFSSVVFSPDGTRLAAGHFSMHPFEDQRGFPKARVWDAATGRELLALVARQDSVHAVAFTPDGGALLTQGSRTVKFWDLAGAR